jgi:hypothetical protein
MVKRIHAVIKPESSLQNPQKPVTRLDPELSEFSTHIHSPRTLSFNLTLYSHGQCSRYSDWLRAGRLRGRSSSPGKDKSFLFSTSSRLILGPTQPSIQRVPRVLSPGVKRPGREAEQSPTTSAEVKKT